MYYKCCKTDSHSSATNFGFDKKLKIDFPVCTIYSIRIAICISRTAIYRDAVLVGDTQPYKPRKSWDEVLLDDRKKLGMDTADPQNRSECRGRLRRRLVKQVQPSVEDNGL